MRRNREYKEREMALMMEFKRELPLHCGYDVIVVGGGPAGCAAAVAAAREGAKTLLVEATGMLGGMATAGLVNAFAPYTDWERVLYGGIALRVLEAMKFQMPHVDSEALHWVPIDPEALKRIYDGMVTGAGADILFNTMLCAVEMADEHHVGAVVVNNKAGLAAYKAKAYVDCTGDADLCAWAGAEYEQGGGDGNVQPSSLCFVLSNVDEDAFRCGPGTLHIDNPDSCIHAIVESGRYDIPDKHICAHFSGPNTMSFNAGHVHGVDNTDPLSVSRGLAAGRKLAYEHKRGLADHHPAFADSYLAATAPVMGVRESRRVVGDYVFTLEDYLARRSFGDEILRNNYYIDIHNTREEGARQKGSMAWNSDSRFERYGKGESHGLPYRCLTPKALRNVLVAGRSVSCDRAAQGSLRVMPACLCMGEAAGIAAKFASDMPQADVHAVDVQRLRQRLKEEGAYLP